MAARKAERGAVEADEAAQETGPAEVKVPRLSRTYVHAVHPDHGEPVVFVPGELLPDWVEVKPS
jgi:hypothetical protein